MKKTKPLPGALSVIGKDHQGRKKTLPTVNTLGFRTRSDGMPRPFTTYPNKELRNITLKYMDGVNYRLAIAHERMIEEKQNKLFGKERADQMRKSRQAKP